MSIPFTYICILVKIKELMYLVVFVAEDRLEQECYTSVYEVSYLGRNYGWRYSWWMGGGSIE